MDVDPAARFLSGHQLVGHGGHAIRSADLALRRRPGDRSCRCGADRRVVASVPRLSRRRSVLRVARGRGSLARRVPPRDRVLDLVELAVFAGLSVFAVRAVVWWAIVAPVVLAGVIARAGVDGRERDDRARPVTLAAAIVGVAALIAFVAGRGTDPGSGAPRMVSFAPELLVEVLRDSVPDGSNVFASQLHASWAELSAPELRYMVDSRVELFPSSVWDDYFLVSGAGKGWDEILGRGVDAVLLEPEQAPELGETLAADDRWRLVGETADGAVYVRN